MDKGKIFKPKGRLIMKEFHIINVGNSLLTNLQRSNQGKKLGIADILHTDNEFWKEKIDDPNFLNSVFEFLKSNPEKNSAELNTFLKVVKNRNTKNIEVYLPGTKTQSNEICVRTIERFLKEKGFSVLNSTVFSGYFWEARYYDEKFAREEFVKGVAEMLDKFIYLVLKKKSEGYDVYINPTGGFKAHVIACALAGFLTGCKVYYMHEEFKEVVFLPELFYLPKGREVELLNSLRDRRPRSGHEYQKIKDEFEDAVERLKIYGLVEVEMDEEGQEFRIRITNRGILFLKQAEEILKK
jgi:putative CRISPR-associated protein (TIGR02619 family)